MSKLRQDLIKLAYEKPEIREDLMPLLRKASRDGIIDYQTLDEMKKVDTGSQQAFTNLRNHTEKAMKFEESREIQGIGKDLEHAANLFVEMRHLSHDLEKAAVELDSRFKTGLDRLKKIKSHVNKTLDEAKPKLEKRLEEYREILDERGEWTREEEQAARYLYQILQFIPDAKIPDIDL